MQRLKKSTLVLCIGAAVTSSGAARAFEPPRASVEPKGHSAPAVEPTIDPFVRALLIGLAASLLREAAASPDPATALGEALERKLMFVLRSPEFMHLAEGLVGHVTKEAPPELREPLQLFALSVLKSLRREVLDGMASRPGR